MTAAPATLATFKEELTRLVAHFSSQHPYFTGPDYNEAKLREDFLNPLFAALGWDVGNRKGLIHTEREVDIEVRTEISGRQKRADYVFRIARLERFTCEAKKPAETLHGGHAYQAKRDAYARGIPFAVLSDFEDIRFYVVGARPHRSESVTVGQWKHLHFTQYLDSATELWDLLSYENVVAGSVDRLIDGLPKRTTRLKSRQGYLIRPDRTKSLDAEFLNFLDEARQRLGSDLLKHNDREDLLAGNRLNEAAQRILDRLVFLRICEDRGIDTGTLLSTQLREWWHQQHEHPRLKRGAFDSQKRQKAFPETVEEEPPSPRYAPPAEGGLYRAFVAHVRALDQRPPSYQPFFNGQLFKEHFSEDLVVGDEWLANFIDELTADDEGYNFADIKVEILGDAYERFLGKVLRPQGRGATIEDKPEVRKAGGVYYTPRYIVDYIVEQTVGRQLEGKTPAQVTKLRFLDPACGSGSFLIRVYERVMEHHLRHFTERVREFQERAALDGTPLEKLLRPHRDEHYLDDAGNVRLTTRLKRQILKNNVYGVDIDAQAVEVTQLSLYLKMLEGENRESLHQQTKDLFNKEALLPPLDQNIKCGNSLIGSDFSLDPAELVRVNAFDWDIGFEKIMNAGGFDAVVGNPPYGMLGDETAQRYINCHFVTAEGRFDLFELFIEKAITLSKPAGGFLSFIVPSPLLSNVYSRKLREHMLATGHLVEITNFGMAVFSDPTVHTCIFTHQKSGAGATVTSVRMKVLSREQLSAPFDYSMPQAELGKSENGSWDIFISPKVKVMINRLAQGCHPLSDFCYIRQCIKTGNDDNYVTSSSQPPGHPWMKSLRGRSIDRYDTKELDLYLKYGTWLARNWQNKSFYETPKIAVRETGARITATLDLENRYFLSSLYSVYPKAPKDAAPLAFILGVINSRFATWFIRLIAFELTEGAFTKIRTNQFGRLPMPSHLAHPQLTKLLVGAVERMLVLSPKLRQANSDTERAALENAIRKTDRDIDQLVYQLYGLTPEEIALVEGTADTADVVTEA